MNNLYSFVKNPSQLLNVFNVHSCRKGDVIQYLHKNHNFKKPYLYQQTTIYLLLNSQ